MRYCYSVGMHNATVNPPLRALPAPGDAASLMAGGELGHLGYGTPPICAECRQPYSESSASPFDDDCCRECGLLLARVEWDELDQSHALSRIAAVVWVYLP